MPADSPAAFGELLRRERRAVPGLTQERLADAAALSWREISDLERGLRRRPRDDTVRRLADALQLIGTRRAAFERAALGRPVRDAADDQAGAGADGGAGASKNSLASAWDRVGDNPIEAFSLVVAALDTRGTAAARSVLAQWQQRWPVEPAWLSWVAELISLTAAGRLHPPSPRPRRAEGYGPFLGRQQQAAELSEFLSRVQRGHGGLALVLGAAGIGKSRLLVEVLADLPSGVQLEWMTFDRGEAGYQGWRRLLAPLWTAIRRTELAPPSLLPYAATLDEVLLVAGDGKPAERVFPGEVAAAIAALVIDVALRRPVLLVIDDAHRGGASSDHLLLDVARRVSDRGVGIIAALRPDELEDDSPLRSYDDQAGGRVTVDQVALIRVPPFDIAATADLLRQRTGVLPPPGTAELVMRQTGGRPQLINSIQVVVPPDAEHAASWVVGRLDAEGVRVLESTIHSRPPAATTVLQAAALSAVQGRINPDLVARITDRTTRSVEALLEEERRHGPILAAQFSEYCFKHDNWIDALLRTCPPDRRRALHARCLELLRDDPEADVRQLARHAVGAGPPLVGARELVSLTSRAADLAVGDYAFGTAAELYEEAARHAGSEDRIDLLIKQADALRFRGQWAEARGALKLAASLARASGNPGSEATALLHLERLTWSYGLDEKDLTQQIRDVIDRLPADDSVLRAQAQAALAMRLSITTRQYEGERADLVTAARAQLPSVTDPLARADIILGIRHGLQDELTPEELLDFDRQLFDLAIKIHSTHHLEEALASTIVDLIRSGQLLELPAAVREHRDFAARSGASLAIYSQALIDAMLELARGDFEAADRHTAEAARLSSPWGGSMAGEALMAQAGWLLYETGQVEGLNEILSSLPAQNVSSLNEPVWSLAAGIIEAETGNASSAIRIIRDVFATSADLRDLPRGPARIGILAAAAMVLGHPVVCGELPAEEAAQWGTSIADLITAHPDKFVLAGWPAVFLGSKHRFAGLACLAAGQAARASDHLASAVYDNSGFAVLHTRTRFDLARALIRQPDRRSEGLAEMAQVAQRARELGMNGLVAQADAELDRWANRRDSA